MVSEEEEEKRKRVLDEADVEEEKRDLITREIGKFREIMKVSFVLQTWRKRSYISFLNCFI